jgi:hypothetical protein
MDPVSLGLAGAQLGISVFQAFNSDSEKRNQVRSANKQIQAQNRFSMQNWQYGEQMRQRQNRQNQQLYEMKKRDYEIQKELDYDAYKEFYEDSQIKFDNLIRDTKLASFQAANKLAAFQGKAMAGALARGATGRRAGRSSQQAALFAGMQQQSRADKLVFQEQQMDKSQQRAAKRTDLRIRSAFNRVGQPPEDLPMAPMPVMGQMNKMPSKAGLFTDIGMGALNAVGTYASLAAPSAGTPNQDFNSWHNKVINEPYNPLGGSKY